MPLFFIQVKMGNSESQYTFQGSKNHSHAITGAKQKPCSLKIRGIHAKDDKSLHGWAHGGSGAGYKSRSLARSCLSHFKSNQPYASRLGGPAAGKVSKGSAHSKPRAIGAGGDFLGAHAAFAAENGFHHAGQEPAENRAAAKDRHGHLLNCYAGSDSLASTPPGEDQRSPRVLIRTLGKLDGCLRVEFHSGAGRPPAPPEAEAAGGPVRLLRYSPSPGPRAPSPPSPRPSPAHSHSRPRSSKGSSLSSESSWYDSPWGHAEGSSEAEGPFAAASPAPSLHAGFAPGDPPPFHPSASLSSLRELYPGAALGSPCGARLSDEDFGAPASLSHRVSFASDMDVLSRVGRGDPGQYASFTLPCRKSKALAEEDAAKKDSLKARMRRISDWTGSLSRKKRKLQVSELPGQHREGGLCFPLWEMGVFAEGAAPLVLRPQEAGSPRPAILFAGVGFFPPLLQVCIFFYFF